MKNHDQFYSISNTLLSTQTLKKNKRNEIVNDMKTSNENKESLNDKLIEDFNEKQKKTVLENIDRILTGTKSHDLNNDNNQYLEVYSLDNAEKITNKKIESFNDIDSCRTTMMNNKERKRIITNRNREILQRKEIEKEQRKEQEQRKEIEKKEQEQSNVDVAGITKTLSKELVNDVGDIFKNLKDYSLENRIIIAITFVELLISIIDIGNLVIYFLKDYFTAKLSGNNSFIENIKWLILLIWKKFIEMIAKEIEVTSN